MGGRLPSSLSIPSEVTDQLGWCVYLYVDPRDGRPFYVGKGLRRRILAYLSQAGESRKVEAIAAIRAAGLEPRLEVLAHKLESEQVALRVEAAAIDLLVLEGLTNEVRGRDSIASGRMTLGQRTSSRRCRRI